MQVIPVDRAPHFGLVLSEAGLPCTGKIHVGTAALGCPAARNYRAAVFLRCHPERSTSASEANRRAQSEDPYPPRVWSGHSLRQAQGRLCPLPLILILTFDFPKSDARGLTSTSVPPPHHESGWHSLPIRCKKDST